MIRNESKFKSLISLTLGIVSFSVIAINACAAETFWLTKIATPYKLKNKEFPELPDPDDNSENTTAITLKDNKLIVGTNDCSVVLDSKASFSVDRTFVKIIGEAGGEKKFDSFLKDRLHTDMKLWTTKYIAGDSDNLECSVLRYSFVYRSKNELIVYSSPYFYKFVLGKELKFQK